MINLDKWFTCDDLIQFGFTISEINKSKEYPTYLEMGRIKVFYMCSDHWQILPPDVDFDSIDSMTKRSRVYTFKGLICMIYEWYSVSDYGHLNLPRI